ncbi:MAG: hypothetical protein LBK03_07860 [Bacteroidales bacterium]|nr:hypothetical protein [Bacteroidales bacterium]
MKKFILVLLALAVGFANAQTLEKKKIMLRKNGAKDKLSDFIYNFNTEKDDNNYYIEYHPNYWAGKAIGVKDVHTVSIVDKELKSIKTAELSLEKGETYHGTLYTTDHIVLLCDRYDKKNKEMNILMKRFSKNTGAYVSTTTVAQVKTPTWTPWMYGSTSPDETKFGIVFLAENKEEKIDEFHAFMLNRDGEMIWQTTEKLEISNEDFAVRDVAISNEGQISIAFTSEPKNKRSANQTTYLDLARIGEESNDHISIPLDNRTLSDISIKALRNGNLFFACLFSQDKDNHPTHLQTIMFDADKFEVTENSISEIPPMESKSRVIMPVFGASLGRYAFNMAIKKIEELENNELAIVCEQQAMVVVTVSGTGGTNRTPCYLKGVIMTAFANPDGSVENYSVYDRFQKSNFRKFLSCYVFTMGNQVCYLFNENPKNFAGKTDETFDGNYPSKSVIVCNKVTNGSPAELTFITDKSGNGGRCIQSLLLKDGNKLLIATGNTKEVDLEIITLE